MIFAFSIRDFGHPKFLKSQFGHSVMKILAKSLPGWTRLLVPEKFTFPSVLTKHCGMVPGMVDRWHHLLRLSL